MRNLFEVVFMHDDDGCFEKLFTIFFFKKFLIHPCPHPLGRSILVRRCAQPLLARRRGPGRGSRASPPWLSPWRSPCGAVPPSGPFPRPEWSASDDVVPGRSLFMFLFVDIGCKPSCIRSDFVPNRISSKMLTEFSSKIEENPHKNWVFFNDCLG